MYYYYLWFGTQEPLAGALAGARGGVGGRGGGHYPLARRDSPGARCRACRLREAEWSARPGRAGYGPDSARPAAAARVKARASVAAAGRVRAAAPVHLLAFASKTGVPLPRTYSPSAL